MIHIHPEIKVTNSTWVLHVLKGRGRNIAKILHDSQNKKGSKPSAKLNKKNSLFLPPISFSPTNKITPPVFCFFDWLVVQGCELRSRNYGGVVWYHPGNGHCYATNLISWIKQLLFHSCLCGFAHQRAQERGRKCENWHKLREPYSQKISNWFAQYTQPWKPRLTWNIIFDF